MFTKSIFRRLWAQIQVVSSAVMGYERHQWYTTKKRDNINNILNFCLHSMFTIAEDLSVVKHRPRNVERLSRHSGNAVTLFRCGTEHLCSTPTVHSNREKLMRVLLLHYCTHQLCILVMLYNTCTRFKKIASAFRKKERLMRTRSCLNIIHIIRYTLYISLYRLFDKVCTCM
jgi:hypothetical protein